MTRIANPYRDRIQERKPIVSDSVFLHQWSRERPTCYFTDSGPFSHSPILQTHHIVGGQNRSDEACNLVRVCERCHQRIHRTYGRGEVIPLGLVLSAKLLWDPGEFDVARIEELLGNTLTIGEAFR